MEAYLGSKRHHENYLKAVRLGHEAKEVKRLKRIEEYNLDPKCCPGCQLPLSYQDVTKKRKKFCGSSCSAKVSNAKRAMAGNYHSDETKNKIKSSLLSSFIEVLGDEKKREEDLQEKAKKEGISLTRPCHDCGMLFKASRHAWKTQSYCSRRCSGNTIRKKLKNLSDEDRKIFQTRGKENVKKQMEKGTWKGWSGRGAPSFPEQFMIDLLTNDGFTFQREKHCAGFSIDFAFEDVMIAFEVDGKQHDYPENAARDRRKEVALKALGWTVVRLRWHTIKNKAGIEKVMEQYNAIKKLIVKKQSKVKNVVDEDVCLG